MKTILLLTTVSVGLLFALWYLRRHRPEIHSVLAPFAPKNLSRSNARDDSRWKFINNWQVAPQHDDRTPILVRPLQVSGSASADRSTARRSHQRMYRQWSSERHD